MRSTEFFFKKNLAFRVFILKLGFFDVFISENNCGKILKTLKIKAY